MLQFRSMKLCLLSHQLGFSSGSAFVILMNPKFSFMYMTNGLCLMGFFVKCVALINIELNWNGTFMINGMKMRSIKSGELEGSSFRKQPLLRLVKTVFYSLIFPFRNTLWNMESATTILLESVKKCRELPTWFDRLLLILQIASALFRQNLQKRGQSPDEIVFKV